MKSFSIKISGLIQGVFFRQSAKEKADGLGITGWVRNEPSGSVFLEIEGEKEAIEKFLDWCKLGSPAAIDSLEIFEQPLKNFKDFSIIY